jgi:glycosyltransferase involved in cell wall biosynthesis
MHVLFVHHNFPAQFGHVASYLVRTQGYRCTFASEQPGQGIGGIERVRFQSVGAVTEHTDYCVRTFEAQVRRSRGLFSALQARPDLRPDLIVGHSGFVSTLFLRELYDCPIINYFEFFYRTWDSDLDFRRDLPSCETIDLLRARTRNAILLLDLNNCDAGYAPTHWQREQFPGEYQAKLRVIFDGIDTNLWRPQENPPRRVGGWRIPPDQRIVTYVSRGLEAMRGFDIFMKFAKRLGQRRSDVVFLVVGEDRTAYGGDLRFTQGKSFKQWVLEQDDYDLSRILFVGRVPPPELADLFSLTDLHVYLTAPFVLSWSLMDALACGAVVLASDTPPVREMIRHETNGLLTDFFDVDAMVEAADRVLDDPQAFRHLGRAGTAMIQEHYTLDACALKMLALYQEVALRKP